MGNRAQRSDSYYGAHKLVSKGDPRHNGPYLDDIRAAAEKEYRKMRENAINDEYEKAQLKEEEAEQEEEDSVSGSQEVVFVQEADNNGEQS